MASIVSHLLSCCLAARGSLGDPVVSKRVAAAAAAIDSPYPDRLSADGVFGEATLAIEGGRMSSKPGTGA
jgi:hypothetical protein